MILSSKKVFTDVKCNKNNIETNEQWIQFINVFLPSRQQNTNKNLKNVSKDAM